MIIRNLKFSFLVQWVPQEALSSPITSASYSCNSQLVYASFADGNIAVFDAESLRLRCRIAPSAYMPQPTPNRYRILQTSYKVFIIHLTIVIFWD